MRASQPLRSIVCDNCDVGLAPDVSAAPATRSSGFLSTRAAREGERKRLTVLIADIAGSTAFIDHLNAEEADQRLGIIMTAIKPLPGSKER